MSLKADDFLKQLNLRIRQQYELAELKIENAHRILAQLAATNLLNDRIVLGPIVLRRSYDSSFFDQSSGQVVQAALRLPGGFGVVLWDSEELAELAAQARMEYDATDRFVPFADCSIAIKALVATQVDALLDRFCDQLPSS